MRRVFLLGIVLIYVGAFSTTFANPNQITLQTCGIIDSPSAISYPLDRREFQLINPYGRPSGRFNGLLHAGDDWIKINGSSLGEPVHAVAAGRVTYSNPTGWGRDKGVVILEHIMADGSYIYTLYGHMEESDTYKFPQRGSCLNTGDIVGVIGDPRPAPHLHFEIRNFGPVSPGGGYSDVDPTLLGWYNPRQFIENWRAWLHPAHRWHIMAGDADGVFPPPILRADGSLVLIDGHFFESYDAEGRLLTQYRLADSVEPIGLAEFNSNILLLGVADGRVQYWNQFGGLVEQWETELETITQGPIVFGDLIFLVDHHLHVFNANRERLSSYPDITAIHTYAVTSQLTAILADNWQLYIFRTDGSLLSQTELLPNSDVIASPDGGFFLRNQGELIRILPDGTWQTILDNLSINRSDNAMLYDPLAGQLILWGVFKPQRLLAISLDGEILWETDIHQFDYYGLTRAKLVQPNQCTIILASQRGYVVAFDSATGQLTGQIQMWGQTRTRVWMSTFSDLIHVQIADQIVALDIPTLSRLSCGS